MRLVERVQQVLKARGVFWGRYGLYIYALIFGAVSIALTYSDLVFFGRGSIWGITTGESKLGGIVWASVIDPGIAATQYYKEFPLVNPLSDPAQMIVIGILLGGVIASLALGEFSLKHLPNTWMLIQALLGGFLLGYGSRLALGCNIGNFLSAWASAGLNAVSFTLGMIPGVFIGSKIFEKIFLFRAGPITTRSLAPPPNLKIPLTILAALLAVLLALYSQPRASLFLAFGIVFGVIGYLSKLCWATGLREIASPIWGSGKMLKAVLIAIAIYAIGVWILYIEGAPLSLALAKGAGQLQIFIGGVIFGIGMGIAGTCIFSSEWRAGSGSIYSMVVLASTILIGMPVLAYHYQWWKSILPQPLPNMSFYSIMGPLGILPTLAFLLILILIAHIAHRAYSRTG
ncbi:MAG: hypothetical protein DJ555_06990 [Desulfurococcaceae archaeon]|nr:MAG: hypothetical protein DJ555_06990 [Desulfurococcaceae archaeon]